MNRLCIFSFFEKRGEVHKSVEIVLEELLSVSQRIIVVINGHIKKDSILILEKYTQEIIIRNNQGGDAGAYADIMLNYLGEEIKQYEELIFCNDTFWGPFVPFTKIFDIMDREKVDFWGLNYVDRKMLSHIQSYFLVFRERIISSGDLLSYFYENSTLQTEELINIYARFELCLFNYLVSKKYKFGSYSATKLIDIYNRPDVGIIDYNLPIIKKRFFSETCYDDEKFMHIVEYLKKESSFNLSYLINESQKIQTLMASNECLNQKKKDSMDQCAYSMQNFCNLFRNKKIFLYGTGITARYFFFLCVREFSGFQGFVVSDEKYQEEQVLGYPVIKQSKVKKDSIIIMTVTKSNEDEIREKISHKDNLISIWE